VSASVVWRIIIGAVVGLVIAIAVRAFFDSGDDSAGDDGEPEFVEVESDDRALDPGDATLRAPVGTAIAVRGYVYDDGAFVQLCDGLTTEEPPRCRGPVLLVRGLDLARLAIIRAERDGATVLYTEEPVVLGGTVDGTALDVVEIFSG
jgi:hypothetical protein